MTGDEWLNIQDMFALFLGRWLIIYLAAAVAGAVTRTFILFLWMRPATVRIVRQDDDES